MNLKWYKLYRSHRSGAQAREHIKIATLQFNETDIPTTLPVCSENELTEQTPWHQLSELRNIQYFLTVDRVFLNMYSHETITILDDSITQIYIKRFCELI
ncbi:hypothetical protein NZD89_07090 [Alicyclobacillus fastidiosus]|uniref:Uncharacterized protein n=1 Tax=Alicyclobacillus fastidiosus TaxID=392011 RepID=A0ABY6ZKN3_9BACL|nr:hypothetical protein [Alicyclobacillus fastidiosus]WAH43158.1 hypothetical protein NZD89_07090 [Alicyclobacillus fastidiosus]